MEKKLFYKSGYLNVSGGHTLYYELYGNPKGKPAVFFHGGPGIGFDDKDKRFFDPKVWNVLFFDQRGAGKSTPFASIKNNTTQDLINDTKKLMRHIGFQRAFLFGGSWGSTLALVFAIQNIKLVTGILVRGVFLANKADITHFMGGEVKSYFPDVWERFISHVPLQKRNNIVKYYLEKMTSSDAGVAEKYAYEWCFYEACLTKMKLNIKKIEKMLKVNPLYKSLSPLEAHYIINKCFIEENYILNNASKLGNIPVSIVHGRYDFVCPPVNSYLLKSKIPSAALEIVISGHSSSDLELERTIKREMKRLQSVI